MQNAKDISEVIKDYDKIYSETGLKAPTRHYRWILSLLNIKKGDFLDIACGEGILLRELNKAYPQIKSCGLDISNEAVKIAQKNAPNSIVQQGDGQNLTFKDQVFDYVTCLGSLEHFSDIDKGITEIARVLKNTGVACILLPNSFSIDIILEVLCKGEDTSSFQIIERRDTKNNWVKLLGKNGLNVTKIYKSNLWPELQQENTYKVKSLKKFLSRLLIKFLCPLNLCREFVFICSKQ